VDLRACGFAISSLRAAFCTVYASRLAADDLGCTGLNIRGLLCRTGTLSGRRDTMKQMNASSNFEYSKNLKVPSDLESARDNDTVRILRKWIKVMGELLRDARRC
jgi:hypothetical protein